MTGDGVASIEAGRSVRLRRASSSGWRSRPAPTSFERARELAEKAEETCLVTVSLDVPVETVIDVRAPLVA